MATDCHDGTTRRRLLKGVRAAGERHWLTIRHPAYLQRTDSMSDPLTLSLDGLPAQASGSYVLSEGTVLAGRYTIGRFLGAGGSGQVYAAHDRKLGREVAVKLLRQERVSEVTLKRFRREVVLAQEVSSPRLVRIHDLGDSEHGPFLSMELCEAETLKARISRGPLPLEEAIRITSEILEALQAIHAVGIVHRDVKPSNVLLDASGSVKLADFGLAFRPGSDESRLTRTDGLVGTLEYLSPEQALGEDLDPRTDLYSLGVVLYEMLSGKLPFAGRSAIGAVVAHLRGDAPDVRRNRSGIPRWLSRFTRRLMEKNPASRYESAAAALIALRKRRVPWRPRRHRLSAAILVIAALIGAGAWHHRRTRFTRVVVDGSTLAAMDARGAVLWRLPQWSPRDRFELLRSRAGLRLAVIRLMHSSRLEDQEENHTLRFYDPQTGHLLRTVPLPHFDFPRKPNTYGGSPTRVDLDRNGVDELAILYAHTPEYPSYVVYFNPEEAAARELFVGSGHHHVVGGVDVDGDGREELVLAGIVNRMAWNNACALIRVPKEGRLQGGATSPDGEAGAANEGLVWYALIPQGLAAQNQLLDDPPNRRFALMYQDQKPLWIGYDGFLSGPATRPASERANLRWAAYEDLRQATRLAEGGEPRSVAFADQARQRAEIAGDVLLAEWAELVRVRAMIRTGRVDEAEERARRLFATSQNPHDVAFETARQMDLQGATSRAIPWYRKGLEAGVAYSRGRMKHEYLHALTLGLGLLGRWDEARELVERSERMYPGETSHAPPSRVYLDWRTTGRSDLGVSTVEAPYFLQWLGLEVAVADGAPKGEVDAALARMERELGALRGPALSLKAEVLEHRGDLSAAWRAAERAMLESRMALSHEVETRALFDVVVRRYARIARATGNAARAAAAERELAAFRASIR